MSTRIAKKHRDPDPNWVLGRTLIAVVGATVVTALVFGVLKRIGCHWFIDTIVCINTWFYGFYKMLPRWPGDNICIPDLPVIRFVIKALRQDS